MFVYNHDICGLHRRMNRFIEELVKSVSSSTSQVNSFDISRLQSYLGALRAYRDWVVAQPQLDLPESHPKQHELLADPEVPQLENESIGDVIRMMELAREELVNSQSARDPAGLNQFDLSRLTAVIDKIDAFLTSYVNVATPLDLPESSPQAALSGPGRKGV